MDPKRALGGSGGSVGLGWALENFGELLGELWGVSGRVLEELWEALGGSGGLWEAPGGSTQSLLSMSKN